MWRARDLCRRPPRDDVRDFASERRRHALIGIEMQYPALPQRQIVVREIALLAEARERIERQLRTPNRSAIFSVASLSIPESSTLVSCRSC